jgi:hypothetical protein
MSNLGGGGSGSEWQVQGDYVFIVDGLAGFDWDSFAPFASSGAMWWDAVHLPVPSTTDRVVWQSDVFAPGDVTGDMVNDLLLRVDGSEYPDGVERLVYVPGPVSAVDDPVLDHPSIIEFPNPTDSPAAPGGLLMYCGDVSGDGLGDICGSGTIDFGPVDGQTDRRLDWQSGSPSRGFGADLDGDGINELYLVGSSTIERYELTEPAHLIAPSAIWNGSGAFYAFPVDLDDDGIDSLITLDFSGQGAVVEITDDDFLTNTARPTGFTTGFLHVVAGDFDGDGQDELAFGGNPVVILEKDGTELLYIEPTPGLVFNFGMVMAAGDVDGNGIDDLVIGAPTTEHGKAFFVFDPLDCLP